MSKVNVHKLEELISATIALARTKAAKVNALERYSEEGKHELWAEWLASNAETIDLVRSDMDTVRSGVASSLDTARAEVMGEAPAVADVATELAAARVLARHADWSTTDALDVIVAHEGSDLAGLLAAEFTARGVLDAEELDGLLATRSADFRAVLDARRLAVPALADMERLFAVFEEVLDFDRARLEAGTDVRPMSARMGLAAAYGAGPFIIDAEGHLTFPYVYDAEAAQRAQRMQG